jgi:hypothetical protein
MRVDHQVEFPGLEHREFDAHPNCGFLKTPNLPCFGLIRCQFTVKEDPASHVLRPARSPPIQGWNMHEMTETLP